MVWFEKIVRHFFYLIDSIVYNGISEVYRLLIDISRTSVLSQSSIQSMANRIYQLLAVFMVFKIIFSLIMYVVNPDDFSDKSKGVSKLGLNVVITLSLLILTPYIFNYAFQLQSIILEDNSLGTLVFGDFDVDSDTDFSVFTSAGDDIAFNAMKPFFLPNSTIKSLSSCSVLEDKDGNFNQNCSGIDFNQAEDEQYNGNAETMAGLTQDKERNTNYGLIDVKNYVYGFEKKNFALMFRPEMVVAVADNEKDESKCIIDYKFFFSTPIGIIILLLLISFCMDVALRSVKLAFLQIIAPIPILSYLDPKSGKDGIFKKWYQLCFKTYLSLFIRLLALYFAIYIIEKIDRMSDVITGAYQSEALVIIFVIIGTLMFAKQLPKILEGLGIKLDGDGKFTLNPLKKFGEEAIGGKKILGLGAAGAAAGLAGVTNFGSRLFHPNSWRNEKGEKSIGAGLKNIAKSPFSGTAGALSAFGRGVKKAMKEENMGKVFSDSYGEAMFAKKQREDLNRKGSTFPGRIAADLNRMTGNYTAAQSDSIAYGTMEAEHKAKMEAIKAAKEATAREKYLKQDKLKRQKSNLEAISSAIESQKPVKEAQSKIDSLRSSGGYYAKGGELKAAGLQRQAEINKKMSDYKTSSASQQAKIDNKTQKYKEEEEILRREKDTVNNTISQMKANNNYYQTNADGSIKRDSNGKEMLTEAARLEENKLSTAQSKYLQEKKEHDDEIKKEQEKLNKLKEQQEEEIRREQEQLDNDQSVRYQTGEQTEEAIAAEKEMTEASRQAFNDLKSGDLAGTVRILSDLGIDSSKYTKDDGTFDKKEMFKIASDIRKIDEEYQNIEAQYENDEREETQRFNKEVADAGIEPSSDNVLAHKADDASHKITTKEAPGTQMSARTVDRGTFTRYSNEFTYNGPEGGNGPHGPHGGHPPQE